MITELKLDIVKFQQYLGMSVSELEGTVCEDHYSNSSNSSSRVRSHLSGVLEWLRCLWLLW